MRQTTGELSLTFRKKNNGQTYIAEQYFKLPLQVLIPHYQDDDGTAFVYLLNPGGGVLQHDRLYTQITVEENAKVLVTTPSTTKFYKMDDGYAKVVNKVTVKTGSVMEYLPEHNVPFAKSKTYQENDFYLDGNCVFIASDMVTAGRVSMGEVFAYDMYSSRTRIFIDGKMKVYDNSIIEPAKMNLNGVGLMEGHLSNGTIYVYASNLKKEMAEELNKRVCQEGISFAAGMIEEGLMIVRFIGDDIINLKNAIHDVWAYIREKILDKSAVRIRKY